MVDGFQVDTAVLRDLAIGMQRATDALRDSRTYPVRPPEAGRSTEHIAGAVRHLRSATLDLAALCESIARKLTDAADTYDRAETSVSHHPTGQGHRAEAAASGDLDSITGPGPTR
jgi:hypothetical protein